MNFRRPANDRPAGYMQTAPAKYARWVYDLESKSGVYIIKSAPGDAPTILHEAGRILYVGESHTDRLLDTLSRHFRSWKERGKPHFVYPLAGVLVAVQICPASKAVEIQNKFIERLRPRDNTLGQPAEPDPW